MNLTHSFHVDSPPDDVWSALLDLERVAGCLPGATVAQAEDGSYRGAMRLKLGPVRANYEGSATLVEVDDDERRAVIEISGREAKGQGTAQATMTSSVSAADSGADVEVLTDLAITGPVAQFGRGIVTDVADTLVGQFADQLGAMLSGDGPAAATSGSGEQDDAPAELDLGAAAWQPLLRAAGPPLLALLVGLILGVLIGRRRGPRRGWPAPYGQYPPPPA